MRSSSFEKGESLKEIDITGDDEVGKKPGKKRGRPSQQITPEQRKKNKIERDRRDRAKKRAEFERLKEVEMKYELLLEEKEQTKVETGKQKAFLEEIHIDVNQKREQLKSDSYIKMKSSFEKGESSKEIHTGDEAGKKPQKKRGRPSQQLTPEEKKKIKIERDRAYRLRKKIEFQKLEKECKMLKKEVDEKKVETEEEKVALEEFQGELNKKDDFKEHLKVNLERAQKENTEMETCLNQFVTSESLQDIIQLSGNEQDNQKKLERLNSREVEEMVNEMRDDNDIEMFSSNVIGDHIVSKTTPPEAVMGPDDTAAVAPCEQSYTYIKTFDDHNQSLNQLEANYTQCANMSIDATQKWVDGIDEATFAGYNVDLGRSRLEHAVKTHIEHLEGMRGKMVEERKAAQLDDAQNELRQYEEATKKARAKVAALGGNITSLDTTPGPGPSLN